MAHVEVLGLHKQFGGTPVVTDVSAGIQRGEFVVILGPSGCGKSTILRMIAGLEEVDSGEIHIAGKRVDKLAPKARGCAMVFQNYALYPHLTVQGNIEYGLRVARMPRAARNRKVDEVARLLELEAFLQRKPSQLSGGQRQRVAIARAIAREPDVFLFDEPLSNLDAKLRTSTRLELRKLHDRIGATSIFVTHDQVEAMTLADRIIILRDGRIAQIGAPSQIYRRPANLFVAGFVGTPPMNVFAGRVSDSSESVRVDLDLPIEIPVSHPDLAPGQSISVGIRPEDAQIGDAGIPARIQHIEDIGAHRLLHCQLGSGEIVVQESARVDRSRGDDLRLTFPRDEISLFDESGKRIDE